MSMQPHLQLLSSFIGMMPIASPFPERCPSQVWSFLGCLSTVALPVFFPFCALRSIRYVPYACCRPSKIPANFFALSDIISPEKRGARTPPQSLPRNVLAFCCGIVRMLHAYFALQNALGKLFGLHVKRWFRDNFV